MPSPLLYSHAGQPPRPLRVLLTRPREQSDDTAQWIRSLGGEPLVFPCLRVEPIDDPALRVAASALAHYDAVALTSVHAVRALLPLVPPDARWPPLVVIGHKTAAELLRHGVSADVVLSGEMATASALATELMRFLGPSSERRRVLFPQAAEGRDELPNLLRAAGLSIERFAAYRTVAVSFDELQPAAGLLRAGQVDLVPLGSPRTAQVLIHALGRDASQVLSHTLVGAIGQTTGSALRELNVRVDVVAEQPSFEDLIEKLAAVQKRS